MHWSNWWFKIFFTWEHIKELEKLDSKKAKNKNFFPKLMIYKKLIFLLFHLSRAML